MSVYTPPALNAVDFGLTTHTPQSITNHGIALSSYTAPLLTAVNFALVAYTLPTFAGIDWELLPTVGFPTQYFGLKVRGVSSTLDLCLVAVADAPAGNQLRVRKGATTYAVYTVDTTDPQASPLRLRTSAGTKAIRLKT